MSFTRISRDGGTELSQAPQSPKPRFHCPALVDYAPQRIRIAQ
jgi:hypothetical protein